MTVARYLLASVASGILFAVLDGVLSANPAAQRLLSYLKPIARERVSAAAGLLIDCAWGFAMAAIFVLIRASLPGSTALVKGLSFGGIAWFFRVLMRAASDAIMVKIPTSAMLYSVVGGAVEMGLIGVLYGLMLA
jgi:hypothetical protein